MSISSEIERINNNVQTTLSTIAETGVEVSDGANSDALPAAAAALANKKQDKLTGTAGQVVGFDENGNAIAQENANTGVTTNGELGQGYGGCTTAAATTAKVATISAGYDLVVGGIVSIKFTYAVPAGATLNINSKGAQKIYYQGEAITAGVIGAGDVATFMYSNHYHLLAVNRVLPAVTTSDAGKFLRVSSSGVWAAETVSNAEEATF